MIEVDKNKWDVYDPDKIMSHKKEGFDTSVLKFLGDIHPREDWMDITHKDTKYIVDFGYYGCEIKLDGYWAVYVIDGNIDDAWDSPIEWLNSDTFIEGIENVQSVLNKYT